MTINKIVLWLKKNWLTTILILFTAAIVLFPNVKAWMLQQAIATGVFNASIDDKDTSIIDNGTFLYTDLAGRQASTESLKGKVVFVNFWASWCPPCIAEMPSLNNLYEQFKNDDRFVFLFITQDTDPGKAIAYLKKSNFNLPVYTLTGNINPAMYSGTLPTTIVLNKQGEMVFHQQGIAGYNTEQFKQQLKNLL